MIDDIKAIELPINIKCVVISEIDITNSITNVSKLKAKPTAKNINIIFINIIIIQMAQKQ